MNHPNEMTLVRCGRCERPICVRCMVDSPVGKKCRDCARSRTHISEASGKQVLAGFLVGTLVAVVAGAVLHQFPLWILALPYGALVGEATLRAGRRSRSPAMQVAAGAAALVGSLAGALIAGGFAGPGAVPEEVAGELIRHLLLAPQTLIVTAIAVAVAVTRLRFL
jgi:hypothetical protein